MSETPQIHPDLLKEMYVENPQAVQSTVQVQEAKQQEMPPSHYQYTEHQEYKDEPVEEEATKYVEEDVQEIQEEVKPKNNIGRNLRILREKAERAERERDEMMRLLEMERQSKSKVYEEPQDDDFDISEDEVVEGKHLKNIKNKINRLESKLKQSQQQSSILAVEAKIKATFPDFDNVVTRDNIEILNAMDPVLASALNKTPDLYEKAVAVYKVIQKFNIDKYDKYESEAKKIKDNKAKPRSLSSVSPQRGDSPLSRANVFEQGLTKEVKEMLNKEMEEAIRNRNR